MQSFRFHALCCAFIVLPASAASIKDAFNLASAMDAPLYTAQQNKADRAVSNAQSLTPEPLSLTISGSNSLDQNLMPQQGSREYEAELGIPLWQWGQKERLLTQLKHSAALEYSQLLLARWELAGAVREAVWIARIAQFELQVAEQKVSALQKISDDLSRQLKAGEVAPLDVNVAQQALLQAQLAREASAQQAKDSLQQFHALAGEDASLPDQAEDIAPSSDSTHPQSALNQAQAELARAQLAQAQYDTRDTPELALSITRERGEPGEEYKNLGKISLRIPFGSDGRTQARVSSANVELIAAQTAGERAQRQIRTAQQAALQARELAQRSAQFHRQNLQLANQAWEWQQRSYRAGQIGLNAYLTAHSDFLERRFAVERAELELGRANSRYLQTLGVLP